MISKKKLTGSVVGVSKLNMMYINIRSVRNKLEDLESMINLFNGVIHIISMTETWLYEEETNYFNLKDYVAMWQGN